MELRVRTLFTRSFHHEVEFCNGETNRALRQSFQPSFVPAFFEPLPFLEREFSRSPDSSRVERVNQNAGQRSCLRSSAIFVGRFGWPAIYPPLRLRSPRLLLTGRDGRRCPPIPWLSSSGRERILPPVRGSMRKFERSDGRCGPCMTDS